MSHFQEQDISSIQRAAASLLAAAVIIMCPGVFPIEGREEAIGFSYDFVFTKPFSKELFPFLEETIRGFIEKNIPIKTLEMVPKNASDLFRHKKRFYSSLFAKNSKETLISIFQMEDFIDLSPPPYPDSTSAIGRVKLDSISTCPPLVFRGSEQAVTRIYGCAFLEKKFEKKSITIQRAREKGDHRFVGQELGLFNIEKKRGKDFRERHTCFWRGKGEDVLHSLVELWRTFYLKRNFEIIVGGDFLPFAKENSRFAKLGIPFSCGEIDPAFGLYKAKDPFSDLAWTFCSKNMILGEIIYFLNFAHKIPKLFHLNAELVFAGKCKESLKLFQTAFTSLGVKPRWEKGRAENTLYYEIRDCFNRRWQGPSIQIEKQQGVTLLTESIFCSLQSVIALILELGEKDLSQKKCILSNIKNFNL